MSFVANRPIGRILLDQAAAARRSARRTGALLVWLGLFWMWGLAALAQTGGGLPGGPVRADAFQRLEKIATICERCAELEQSYHAQVDAYDAARAAYDAQAGRVGEAADAFLAAREVFLERNQLFEDLEQRATDLLFRSSEETNDISYREAVRERDDAEGPALEARSKLDQSRATLDGALRGLERLRLEALAQMRDALRLEHAMHQCEFSCEIEELDLDEPVLAPPEPPTNLIDPSAIPEPENFLGIVAKCAKCQPLAELVNTIRAHRRAFAVSAKSTFESLTNNQQTLDRMEREATILKQQERDLYRHLLNAFTEAGPGQDADWLDQTFDELDQREAETKLREIAGKRAENSRIREGLAETIATQYRGLLEALANYRVHTALLESARKRLADCEKTCPPDAPNATALNDPFIDPAYPVPENFGPIIAKCPECQPLADDLAQAKSERRRVATEIQDIVSLLKSRRASLDRWTKQEEALAKEERELGPLLVIGAEGGVKVNTVLDRLFEIENARTRLLGDMLWAQDEIWRMEPKLAQLLKDHEELTYRVETLQAKLDICEFNCAQDADGGTAVGTGEPVFDPNYPQPEKFTYVSTDCPSCQPLADALNGQLLEQYTVAREVQSIAARIAAQEAAIEALEGEMKALLAREQELVPVSTGAVETKAKAEALRELNQIDLERRRLENRITAATDALHRDDTELVAQRGYYDSLSREISELRARLAACEKGCTDGDDGPDWLVGQGDFVATDCPPCEALASMVNDAVGTLIGAERDLDAAQSRFSDLVAGDRTRQQALEDVLAQERALNDEWLGGASDARKAEIDAELNDVDLERIRLETEKAGAAEARSKALEEVDAAQKRFDKLWTEFADLKAQLAECEKQCAPPDEGAGVAVPDPSPFVTTDCEPCQALASMVNDAVGTLIGVERTLEAAKEKLAGLQTAAAARQQALDAVLARERALNDEWLGGASDDRKAEIDAELNDVDLERNALEDAKEREGTDQGAAKAGVDAAQLKFDDLTRLIADLKAQLAECEKQCAPPDEGAGVAVPDPSPFVTTDCEPCQALASMVNDAVGTLIGVERTLEAAKEKLAGLQTAAAARQQALDEVLARERALNDEWLGGASDDRKAEIDAELNDVDLERNALEDAKEQEGPDQSAAKAEVDAAQIKFDDLTKQIADLKAQLAECEKQCAPPDEGAGVAVPDPSPFVTTDCEPCQALVSMVNDAVGTLIGVERTLEAAKEKLAGLQTAAAARQQALDEVLARERALNDEWLGGASDDRKAEIDAELNDVDLERNALEDAKEREGTDQGAAKAEVDAAQLKFDDLTRLIADLKAQLAECEKQCAPPDEGAGVAVPDPSPFVTTDCEPCAQIAGLLNDVIGSNITTEANLADARNALDAARATRAAKEAEKGTALEAFTAALVEKSRLEKAGADGSAQGAIADDSIARAADLLTEIEALELDEKDLAEGVDTLTTQLAQLREQEAALRTGLRECERQCGEGVPAISVDEGDAAEVGFDPDFILDKLQPETCRGGDECTFEIEATNAGDQAFGGPLFLTESGQVAAGANGAAFGDWHCSPTGNGQSICLNTQKVSPGQTVTLRIPIQLPGFVSAGAQNCVEVTIATDARLLVRMVQLGLSARGFDAGVADGLPGPRTNAAISALAEELGQTLDPADIAAVYAALFGVGPSTTIHTGEKACVDMDVENPPQSAPATPSAAPPTPPAGETATGNGPKIELRFGVGIGGGGHEGEGRHDEGPSIRLPLPGLFHFGN